MDELSEIEKSEILKNVLSIFLLYRGYLCDLREKRRW
jgi:hypothetical protein